MNICFVANFSKTYLFDVLAKKLAQDNDINVFWIVVNKPLNLFLVDKYGKENVLYINREHIKLESEPIGEFNINELLYGDRTLRYEMENGKKFLTNTQKPIFDFLKDNKISFIFGEQTWAHELLIVRIANSIGITYSEPQSVRIPNNRIAFFEGEIKQRLIEVANPEPNDFDGIFKIEKPSYLAINDAIIKRERSLFGRVGKIRRFFKKLNDHDGDPCLLSPFLRASQRLKEEVNKEMYRFVKCVSFDSIKDTKYVFYPLHKQPENSIDVYGRYYEDQLLNIINLWRKLPIGWQLVVKEHTNAIGDRSLSFYNSILTYPNVVLVNERTNSWDLIRNSQLVVTITGTVAYEAALMQVPSVTFSDIFFSEINSCLHKTMDDLVKCNSLEDWIIEIGQRSDNRREFCKFIMDNSFAANFTDPITDPSVLNDDNIHLLTKGFRSILDTVKI